MSDEWASEDEKRLAGHTIKPRQALSWHLSAVDSLGRYVANDAYSITWTSGTLVLDGDLDPLMITHWQGLWTLEKAVEWVERVTFDDMMSRSTAKKVFDPDGTAEAIIGMANMDAILGLERLAPDKLSSLRCEQYEGHWEVPDGYELWHDLYCRYDPDGDPSSILRPAGRRIIKQQLLAELLLWGCEDICEELEIDDYHGTMKWPDNSYIQFAAIKRWAELVRPTVQGAA